MKTSVLFFLLFASFVLYSPAQGPGGTPPSGSAPAQGTPSDGLALQQIIVHTYTESLYRKPSEKELEAIAPPAGIANRYRDFLKNSKAGIFRLVTDSGCSENSKIVRATDDCLKYTMPGAGNSFSFRTASYRLRELADLNLSNNVLEISGLMMNGMLVNLGDLPIEDVTLKTKGLEYLTTFQPATDLRSANTLNDQLVTGVRRDGFLYKRFLPVLENSTYALRSVAYRGKFFRSIHGVAYNEFDFDKRRDIVVAFRIEYKDSDGSLIIVWKQLRTTYSPKLEQKASRDRGPN